MPHNTQEREKLIASFYKEMGQYCNDPFDEIAEWWTAKLDVLLSQKIKEIREVIENHPINMREGDERNDTIIAVADSVKKGLLSHPLLQVTKD